MHRPKQLDIYRLGNSANLHFCQHEVQGLPVALLSLCWTALCRAWDWNSGLRLGALLML